MTTRQKLEPRFANRRALKLVGVSIHHDVQDADAFAKQWQNFIPLIGTIPARVGAETYGVVLGSFGGDAEEAYVEVAGATAAERYGVLVEVDR
jgi:hypothetical protein